jgi:hypothetical protein
MVYGSTIATAWPPFIKIVDVDYHQEDESAIQFCGFWAVLEGIRTRAPVAKAVVRVDGSVAGQTHCFQQLEVHKSLIQWRIQKPTHCAQGIETPNFRCTLTPLVSFV